MDSPHPVYDVADRYVDAYAALRPIDATFAGIDGHDHRWGDLGPDGVEEAADLFRRTRAQLAALPPGEDRWAQLAVRVLDDDLALQLEGHDHDDPLRDIAHIASTIPETREALEVQDTSDPDGREAVVARLEGYADALEGWRAKVDRGRQRGRVVAQRQVRSTTSQLHELAEDDGPLRRVATAVVAADGALADRVQAALPAAGAAATRTARWLTEIYLPGASEADGVGEERYLRSARGFLGSDLDPAETYAWGWDRIGELTARARSVARELSPDTDLPATIARLRGDPAFAAPNPDAFREAMQARQSAALDALDGVHFDVPGPIRRVEVKLAGGGAPGAYYNGPSEDFSRPGTIWWSLPEDGPVPLYEEVSTAYHEGFPGHHLQIGIQVGLADRLSRAHRTLIWNPGYGEGWALYTEQLMDELGMFEHPAYVLGYLAGELLRATRVVVDIGLHLGWRIPDTAPVHAGEAWDFPRAVDALQQLAFLPAGYADSEVTRYLGWPGQAISYAVGQRAIVGLREERRRRDGAGFELKAFHADVLGSGPVGLDLLRAVVLGFEHR
ncbi:MAG: DUF885 domain-containing protein [Nitriliruptor sp.]|uniref:DUF885 domain-containing protein n=1 Tax=Nitriliruptor sp. TaxID=2448056 RepID=UPI0034A005CB